MTLDGDPVKEQNFTSPLKLDLCGHTIGNNNNYTLYRYGLGDALVFEEGKKVDLEVIYSQADYDGKRTIFMTWIGEQEQSKSSLWQAYMGI